jgi:hypothetical protein
MKYCDYHRLFALDKVENSEGKSVQQRPPGRAVNYRVRKGPLGYGRKYGLGFLEELESEAISLALVPGGGIDEILFRLGPEADFDGHSRRRMSARTSDARRPGFLSTS